MLSFYSCTCILHTLLDVVSKNYTVKQTRKQAGDEKTNSENTVFIPYFLKHPSERLYLWVMGRKKKN